MSNVDEETDDDRRDRVYERGSRSALLSILQTILRGLGYEGSEAEHAKWILERERTVAQLRMACEEFGDNDWPNDLHLGDVIEKHLCRHLR